MSNIYFIGLKKKTCLGVFRIEKIRDKDNETGLKEGGRIEISTTVLSIYAMHRSLSLELLTLTVFNFSNHSIVINFFLIDDFFNERQLSI